jgi:formin 2/WAS/WASL-interacting protein
MGFLDKAKKLAEQAQSKLDEVQKQVNQPGSSSPAGGPITEYDKHGRPIPPEQSASPPHGDPLRGSGAPTAADGPTPDPAAPPTGGFAPSSAPPTSGGWSTPAPPAAPTGGGWGAPPSSGPPAPTTPGLPPTEPASGPSEPVEGPMTPPEAPGVPAAASSPPAEGAPAGDEDRNRPSYAPPKLTGGDPLAG